MQHRTELRLRSTALIPEATPIGTVLNGGAPAEGE